nr:MAG TPA: leucine-rich repeat protein [Caudoviricetes sp.]
MNSLEVVASEIDRIDEAKGEVRKALKEKGVAVIPNDATIDAYAEAIRSYEPRPSQPIMVYKRSMFDQSPQEEFPPVVISPTYAPADLYFLFSRCNRLRYIPAVEGVERASNMAYYASGCSVASGEVTIPNIPSCTTLERAFAGCQQLEGIIVGDAPMCTSIGSFADGCRLAKTIKLGYMPAVTNVSRSFLDCSTATRIETNFGSKVKSINYAFARCSMLREITGILDITNAVFGGVFNGCSALEEVRLKGLKDTIALHDNPNLSLESARYLINEAQVVTGKTIYLPQKLVDDHENEMVELGDVASAKGWIINYR